MKNVLLILLLILTACSYREVKNIDYSKIEIEINSSDEVRINDERVDSNAIGQKLIDLKSKDSIEVENYRIILDIDEEADHELVSTVKLELRKASLLHIEYKNITSRPNQ